jgi:hypothetical protein
VLRIVFLLLLLLLHHLLLLYPRNCCKVTIIYRYAKFSNMRKGGKLSNDGQNGKDRQMVDM